MRKTIDIDSLDRGSIDDWIASFDVVLFDCDGVLWLHDHLYDGATDAINAFVAMGKKVYLITNNNQLSREQMLTKCRAMNFNLELESMICVSHCTARYLSDKKFDKKVYVIGSKVLKEELDAAGIRTVGGGPDVIVDPLAEHIKKDLQRLEDDVGAVVVGFDEHFSFPKLFKAINYLREPEIDFIATNTDQKAEFPFFTFPDSGPILAAIENVVERKPIVIGKPSKLLTDLALDHEAHRDRKKFLMIGDRLNTDILYGRQNKFQTLLVGTGIHQMTDVDSIQIRLDGGEKNEELENMIPDYFASNLKKLIGK